MSPLRVFHLLCSASALCLLLCQVKDLEHEKEKLQHKLKILKEHENYKGNVEDIVNKEKTKLEEMLDNLLRDQDKLQADLAKNIDEKEDTRKRSDAHCGSDVVL